MQQNKKPSNASLFSSARFGGGILILFFGLGLLALLLFLGGFRFQALLPLSAAAIIFVIKLFETVQYEQFKKRNIVGSKCLVLKEARKGDRGIVRIILDDGRLDNETWSAEVAEGITIEQGKTATVVGLRSIILLIRAD